MHTAFSHIFTIKQHLLLSLFIQKSQKNLCNNLEMYGYHASTSHALSVVVLPLYSRFINSPSFINTTGAIVPLHLDIKSGRVPLFIEAAPAHDSLQEHGRRKYFNGTIDYNGPRHQHPLVPAPPTPPSTASSPDLDSPPTVKASMAQKGKRRAVVLSDNNEKPLIPPPVPKPWTKKHNFEVIHASANVPTVLFKDSDHDKTFVPLSESDQDTPCPFQKKNGSIPHPINSDSRHSTPVSEPSPSKVTHLFAPSRSKSVIPDMQLPATTLKRVTHPDALQLFTPTPKKVQTAGNPYTLVCEDIRAILPPPDPLLPLPKSKPKSSLKSLKAPPYPAFLQNIAGSQSFLGGSLSTASTSLWSLASAPASEPPLLGQFTSQYVPQSQPPRPVPAIPFAFQTKTVAQAPLTPFGHQAQPTANIAPFGYQAQLTAYVVPFGYQVQPSAPGIPFGYQALAAQPSAPPASSAGTVPAVASVPFGYLAQPSAPAMSSKSPATTVDGSVVDEISCASNSHQPQPHFATRDSTVRVA
ncbi:hypothetical protein FA15DRAFT_741290 [Coprinopsis marcescibilis]|uniref:Uncharacterized protein n=1 Tax=Coprinopsis marcescibilis TaxID=230819 RepID=A0A5C3K9T0_COPMA|nr:hypothetical protein FA15DRAFT_741290 [Coprinopsis marcescibilis]